LKAIQYRFAVASPRHQIGGEATAQGTLRAFIRELAACSASIQAPTRDVIFDTRTPLSLDGEAPRFATGAFARGRASAALQPRGLPAWGHHVASLLERDNRSRFVRIGLLSAGGWKQRRVRSHLNFALVGHALRRERRSPDHEVLLLGALNFHGAGFFHGSLQDLAPDLARAYNA
jgi:hypothetical protein